MTFFTKIIIHKHFILLYEKQVLYSRLHPRETIDGLLPPSRSNILALQVHTFRHRRTHFGANGCVARNCRLPVCYKHFIADAWVGGGYALGTPAETGYHHGFQLWNWFNTRNDNIALSFSIRLGFVW